MRAIEAWIKGRSLRATPLTALRTAAYSDALPHRVQAAQSMMPVSAKKILLMAASNGVPPVVL
jgi:hypothetical protein